MKDVIIRKPRPEDAEAIARVHVQTWQQTYRGVMPDDFLDGLSVEKRAENHREYMSKTGYFLAEDGDGILGFICHGPNRAGADVKDGEIYALNLIDRAKRRGAGTALMQAAARELVEQGAARISLWVVRENEAARAFYEAMGGTCAGEEKISNIGGRDVREVSYVWANPSATRLMAGSAPKKGASVSAGP